MVGGLFELAMPVWVAPQFSCSAIVSLALPLFVVTMASQNLPGVAVMRATGTRCRSPR
jgi:benzoate membrane transport protein